MTALHRWTVPLAGPAGRARDWMGAPLRRLPRRVVIAAVAVREGREAWVGEGCACVAVPGLETDGCRDGCC